MTTASTTPVPLPAEGIGKAFTARHSELGRLADFGGWYCACRGITDPPQAVRLVVVLGDYQAGLAVTSRTSDESASIGLADWITPIDVQPPADVAAAFEAGISLADEQADAGTDLLLLAQRGRGNSTPAAAIVGVLGSSDPATVTGRGLGIDDATWMQKAALVRDLMRSGRTWLGDPIGLLAAIAAPGSAFACGVLLQSAVRRTPVIIDGFPVAAAALVAHRLDFRAPRWWFAADCSAEPAHRMALERLDLTPLLELGIAREDGFSATIAAWVLRAALGAQAN